MPVRQVNQYLPRLHSIAAAFAGTDQDQKLKKGILFHQNTASAQTPNCRHTRSYNTRLLLPNSSASVLLDQIFICSRR